MRVDSGLSLPGKVAPRKRAPLLGRCVYVRRRKKKRDEKSKTKKRISCAGNGGRNSHNRQGTLSSLDTQWNRDRGMYLKKSGETTNERGRNKKVASYWLSDTVATEKERS